ncbi:hypothetical protein BDP27DRAFT_1416607 [Rhodocollybia butyracea]|uniref:Uncharacterized protein n=1 Tax=Rhodocollybia butyracea TaxID=206335 RepID=A0A9P5UC98_9AGAR|nr:hypothetical protein BDP27DRAFT_1416607 [Rhodocollybia butyracea]
MNSSAFPCPITSTLYTLVDDSDPGIIYSDGWFTGGLIGSECKATTHGTFNKPNVTAMFHFSGVGVEVYGTVGNKDGSPASTYQVDDLPAHTFFFSANNQSNYRTQFYASPLLSPGNHTLLITALGNDGSQVWLDYILYYPSSNESLVSNSSSQPGPSLSPSVTSEPSAVTNSNAPSVVEIVGGVLGGIVGILLVLIFAYILLLRRRKNPSNHEVIDEFVYNPTRSTYASDGSTTSSLPGTPKWIPTIPRYSIYTRSGQSQVEGSTLYQP